MPSTSWARSPASGPTITRARKSIASFKLRDGMPIGCRVTLRGNRMWDFLDRLIATALPRVRDFRGVPTASFDGRGNYTLGITDHLIFPELDYNKVEKSKGLNVTIVTTAKNDEQAFYLLRELGMPFRGRAPRGIRSDGDESEDGASSKKKPKFQVRSATAAGGAAGRAAIMRKFGLCRICFRNLALQGYLPGVIKASW